MKNTNLRELIDDYINAYNDFDIEGMIASLHSGIVFKNFSNGEINLITNGISEFRAQAEIAVTYFTERRQTITSIQINGLKAEVAIKYAAILATDLPNGMKAGDSLEIEGTSIFYFEDGLISSIEDYS